MRSPLYILLSGMLAVILCHGQLPAQEQKVLSEWIASAGNTGWDIVNGLSIDSLGNLVVAGSVQDTVQKDRLAASGAGRKSSIRIVKFDTAGRLVSDEQQKDIGFGGKLTMTTFRGMILAGAMENKDAKTANRLEPMDIFLTETDKEGKPLWKQVITGNAFGMTTGLAYDALHQRWSLAGYFNDSVKIGKDQFRSRGVTDAFILTLEQDGSVRKLTTIAGKGHTVVADLGYNVAGNLLVCGSYQGKVQFGKEKTLKAPELKNTGVYLAELSNDDLFSRVKCVAAGRNIKVTSLALRGSFIYMAGGFSDFIAIEDTALASRGNEDAFVLCMDSSWKIQWIKQFGGPGKDRACTLTTMNDELIVCGSYGSVFYADKDSLRSVQNSHDIFVISLNQRGNICWIRSLGGNSDDYPKALLPAGDEYLYLTGSFRDSLSVMNRSVKAQGAEDIFIARLENCRELMPAFHQPEYFCEGENLTLDAGPGFTSYEWNFGEGKSREFTVRQPGTCYLTVSAANGCTVHDTVAVAEHPKPVVFIGNDTLIADTATLVLAANRRFHSYSWSTGSTDSSIRIQGYTCQPGLNRVELEATDEKGCTGRAEIFIRVEKTVSQAKSEELGSMMTVYPNPADDELSIVLSGDTDQLSFLMIDSYSHTVYRRNAANYRAGESFSFDISTLPPGMYTLVARQKEGYSLHKIIIR